MSLLGKIKSFGRNIDPTNKDSALRKNLGVVTNVVLPITLFDRAGIGVVKGTEIAASKVGLANDPAFQRTLGRVARTFGTKTELQKKEQALAAERAALNVPAQNLPQPTGVSYGLPESLSAPIVTVGGLGVSPIVIGVLAVFAFVVMLLWRKD